MDKYLRRRTSCDRSRQQHCNHSAASDTATVTPDHKAFYVPIRLTTGNELPEFKVLGSDQKDARPEIKVIEKEYKEAYTEAHKAWRKTDRAKRGEAPVRTKVKRMAYGTADSASAHAAVEKYREQAELMWRKRFGPRGTPGWYDSFEWSDVGGPYDIRWNVDGFLEGIKAGSTDIGKRKSAWTIQQDEVFSGKNAYAGWVTQKAKDSHRAYPCAFTPVKAPL